MSEKVIYLHSQGSEGGKALRDALGIKRLRHDGRSKWVGGVGKVLINWGAGELPNQFQIPGTIIVNPPALVKNMTNKLAAMDIFSENGVRIPPYTRELRTAKAWLEQKKTVFARTVLNGSGGNGIVIMYPEHPDTHDTRANMYVQYVPKKEEYRVHAFRGEVILVQRKGLKQGLQGDDVNWKIRNLANGFIFARNIEPPPQDVIDQALLALRASGLDFGAVDVIWNASQGRAYVLEINTAPGLVGTTVTDYANVLGKL